MADLRIRRATEQRAWLVGPSDAIDAIAAVSGLPSREASDDRLRVIEHDSEDVLADAARAAGYTVPRSCSLCVAGVCCVHRGEVRCG